LDAKRAAAEKLQYLRANSDFRLSPRYLIRLSQYLRFPIISSSRKTTTMLATKLKAAAIAADKLKASSDELNVNIEKFLGGMDRMQANLDKYADEVASLTARIAELEAKAK
jgi:SMC interacting uncharacterized protein involved in chromosome segregation